MQYYSHNLKSIRNLINYELRIKHYELNSGGF